MILSDTPKGAGKKSGKPAKKYGQSAAGRITVTNYANPFDEQRISFPSSPFEQSDFFLNWVSRRITVYQGKCQSPMRDEQERIYPPPYDLFLDRRERRSYRSPSNAKMKLGKVSACHYHFKKSCVVKTDPPY